MGAKKKPYKKRATKKKPYKKPTLKKKERCPIIGITGPAGCGKGTVADYLSAYYGYRGTSFATPLKKAVAEIFSIPRHLAFTEVRELKEGIIEFWGLSPRRMAQLLGTEVGRNIDPQVWVKNMELRTAEYLKLGMGIVIDDARFENEAAWIRENGGKVLHLSRPSVEDGTEHKAHASEAGIQPIGQDIMIRNNGTLEELYSLMDDVMEGEDLAWKLTFKHEETPEPNTEKQDEKPPTEFPPHVDPPVYQTIRHEKVSS